MIISLKLSQQWESNPQPTAYKAVALPLSYVGDFNAMLLNHRLKLHIYVRRRSICEDKNFVNYFLFLAGIWTREMRNEEKKWMF